MATGWGEQRESWVAPTYFARAWGDRPTAVEKVFYNDREGVDAMLDYLGGEPRSVPGLQRAAGGLVRVGLRDGTGQWYETLELRNQRFAVGERGSRYEVVVKNESRKRLEVVLSVDGLDTLDGESASFKKRGYVLGPRETLCVDGFRTSDGQWRHFALRTWAIRMRSGGTSRRAMSGVIGLAVFGERLFGTKPANAVPENRAWRTDGGEGVSQPASLRHAAGCLISSPEQPNKHKQP